MGGADQPCHANLLVFELNPAEILARWVVLTMETTLERYSSDRLSLEFDSQEIAWSVVGILYFVDFVDGARRREADTTGLRRRPCEFRVVPTSVSEDNRPAIIQVNVRDRPFRMSVRGYLFARPVMHPGHSYPFVFKLKLICPGSGFCRILRESNAETEKTLRNEDNKNRVAPLESLTRILQQYSHQARILHRLPDGVKYLGGETGAFFVSLVSQRDPRIDLRCPPRRDVTGQQGNCGQQRCDQQKG